MSGNTKTFIRWEAQRRAAAGDHEGALELVGHAGGQDAALAVLRGRILAQQGRFEAAAEAFRGALASEPDNADAKRGLALSVSRLAGLLLHGRRWLAALACIAILAAGFAMAARRVSNAELARSIATLDSRVEASLAAQQSGNKELAERIARLELALQNQAETSGRSSEQFREDLHRLQKQLAATVTDEELKATRAVMLDSLKRLESSAGQGQKRQ